MKQQGKDPKAKVGSYTAKFNPREGHRGVANSNPAWKRRQFMKGGKN